MVLCQVLFPLANEILNFRLLVSWYLMGQVKFATVMLVPHALYYLSAAMVWLKQQTKKEKLLTWPFVLCGVYKEYKLLQFVFVAWNDVKKARSEKLAFLYRYQHLILFKTIPIILIESYVMLFWKKEQEDLKDEEIMEEQTFEATFGSVSQFLAAYLSSIILGSKGITDFLVYGQCTLLPKKGILEGRGTCRYLLAWWANFCTLMGKVFTLGGIPVLSAWIPSQLMLSNKADSGFKWVGLGCALIHFVPLFIFSLCFVKRVVGSWCNVIKVVFQCPAVIILPMFTHFTIGSKDSLCCGCFTICCKDPAARKLAVSKTLTMVNMAICFCSYAAIMTIYFVFLGVTFYLLLAWAWGLILVGIWATCAVYWLPALGALCCLPFTLWCCHLVEEEWDVESENIV